MISKNPEIEREIIVPYLQEHPEELDKLVKRLIELKPLAAEFVRCYFLLRQYAETRPSEKKNLLTDDDIKKIAEVLAKTL